MGDAYEEHMQNYKVEQLLLEQECAALHQQAIRQLETILRQQMVMRESIERIRAELRLREVEIERLRQRKAVAPEESQISRELSHEYQRQRELERELASLYHSLQAKESEIGEWQKVMDDSSAIAEPAFEPASMPQQPTAQGDAQTESSKRDTPTRRPQPSDSLVSAYDEWQASEQHNRLAEIIETADRVNDDVTPSITPPNMPRTALLTDAELERIDRDATVALEAARKAIDRAYDKPQHNSVVDKADDAAGTKKENKSEEEWQPMQPDDWDSRCNFCFPLACIMVGCAAGCRWMRRHFCSDRAFTKHESNHHRDTSELLE